MYNNAQELISLCQKRNLPLWEIIILDEMKCANLSRQKILTKMQNILAVMKNSVAEHDSRGTMGNIIGGEASLLADYLQNQKTFCGEQINKAMMRALAGAEYNASMGKICAAPTAGSSGIIPAVLITAAEFFDLSDQKLIEGLLVSAGIGKIIVQNATVSGAEGGCQAECGSAAAMAAAALVAMRGGDAKTSLTAATIALKNIMGLICDPIAGLVESPCSKRNASGAVNAMISADLALAGITSVVPFDETVNAMYSVGKMMHPNLRETALGGIAATPTAQKISENLQKKLYDK